MSSVKNRRRSLVIELTRFVCISAEFFVRQFCHRKTRMFCTAKLVYPYVFKMTQQERNKKEIKKIEMEQKKTAKNEEQQQLFFLA